MLYLTTRDHRDAFTAYRALTEDAAKDGGLYIPMRLPLFDQASLSPLVENPFSETVAAVLNQFFSANLNAWDIECCIGKDPLKLSVVGRKTLIAEVWHNYGRSYEYAVSSISDRLLSPLKAPVSSWTRVAIGIAFAFGMFTELCRNDIIDQCDAIDVCVPDGDYSLPAAMLYAKQMGLPIGKIIISSGANSAIWDLINHGQMSTVLLNCVQKLAMERLICCTVGQNEVVSYSAACDRHGVYSVPEDKMDALPGVLFGSVVGKERIRSTIDNVYNSNGYVLSENTALCYAGLQDYRAKTGQGGLAVLFGASRPESD